MASAITRLGYLGGRSKTENVLVTPPPASQWLFWKSNCSKSFCPLWRFVIP